MIFRQLLHPCATAIVLLLAMSDARVFGQCDPTVPTFTVDLTASPNATYLSPSIQRNGLCCGASPPDQCLQFILTLHPEAQGINFDICEGAIPPGALFYQIGCGPSIQVGQPICLNGPGPHILTFCKPGNNTNRYCITSIPAPSAGPGFVVNDGCSGTLTSSGFAPGTEQWTSVFPGPPGAFNGSLSCTNCANSTVTGQAGYPAYVDYQICGLSIAPCSSQSFCDTVRVFFNPLLTASIQPQQPTICYGATGTDITVVPGGGSPPYSYLWNTGASTATINVGPGTYTVFVSDASICPPTQTTVVVTQFQQPIEALPGPDLLICGDDLPIQLNGAVTGASGGIWSGQGVFDPAPDDLNATYMPTAAELASGSFQLTLTTTGNGTCPAASDTVNISRSNSFLNASLTGTMVDCHGANTGSATFLPAIPGHTYQWTPGGASSNVVVGLQAGLHQVQVTDVLGCDTVMAITITEPPPLVASITAQQGPQCSSSQNGSATVTASGGSPGYQYQWSASANGQNTPTAIGLGGGTHSVLVTDANGCTAQAQALLTTPAPITLNAVVPDTVCVNAPVQLSATASGGQGGHVFTWTGIGTGSPITHSFGTSQLVVVSVVDGAGCPGPMLSLPVTVLDLSLATLTTYGDTTICPGGSAVLGAEVAGYPGAYVIDWPGLGITGPGPFNVSIPASNSYSVVVSDVCGNNLQGQVAVTLETPPAVVLPPVIAQGCAPLTVTMPLVQSELPITYSWQLGNGSGSSAAAPTITYPQGEYQVSLTVSTPAGCTASSATPGLVIAHASPVAGFTPSPWTANIENAQFEFSNESTGNIIATEWEFGDGASSNVINPTHTYQSIGSFAVELWVQDQNGCTDSVTRIVVVTPDYEIVVPNVFTPNAAGGNGGNWDPADLSNDIFYPFVDHVQQFRMRIFNRWGELIFETQDLKTGWDGWYRGELSPQDVYVYQLWVQFEDGKEAMRLGDVTLLR